MEIQLSVLSFSLSISSIYKYIYIYTYMYIYILIDVNAAGLSGFAPTFRRSQVGQGPFRSPISLLKTPRNWMILGGPGLRNLQHRCGPHFFLQIYVYIYIYVCVYFLEIHTHTYTHEGMWHARRSPVVLTQALPWLSNLADGVRTWRRYLLGFTTWISKVEWPQHHSTNSFHTHKERCRKTCPTSSHGGTNVSNYICIYIYTHLIFVCVTYMWILAALISVSLEVWMLADYAVRLCFVAWQGLKNHS